MRISINDIVCSLLCQLKQPCASLVAFLQRVNLPRISLIYQALPDVRKKSRLLDKFRIDDSVRDPYLIGPKCEVLHRVFSYKNLY